MKSNVVNTISKRSCMLSVSLISVSVMILLFFSEVSFYLQKVRSTILATILDPSDSLKLVCLHDNLGNGRPFVCEFNPD